MAAKPLILRLKTKNGQFTVDTLTEENTIQELKGVLFSLTNINPNRMRILHGYPPKLINLDNERIKLEQLNLSPKETLIVEESPTMTPTQSIKSIQPQQQEKRTETINVDDRSKTRCTNDYIRDSLNALTKNLFNDNNALNNDLPPGILMRHSVPANNSCLFTSVYFCISGGEFNDKIGTQLRQIIADTVAADTITYNEAFLGKPNREYCTWILNEDHWGGAIELSILSKYYSIEIVAVDTQFVRLNRFGEDMNYQHRILLIYDGIHYDPLILELFDNNQAIQTIFITNDNRILDMALEVAKEAKGSRQYSDVNNFKLRCIDCNLCLTGQKQAQEHAEKTRHQNFAEI